MDGFQSSQQWQLLSLPVPCLRTNTPGLLADNEEEHLTLLMTATVSSGEKSGASSMPQD